MTRLIRSAFGSGSISRASLTISASLQEGNGIVIETVDIFKGKKMFDSLVENIETATLENAPKLVSQVNEALVKIEENIANEIKELKIVYQNRYPELEDMNLDAVGYAKAVHTIGGANDLSKVDFSGVFPPQLMLAVTMSTSTTSGKPLSESSLNKALVISDSIIQHEHIKNKLPKLAPNLTAIVGPEIAAKLVGATGGIIALSKLPSGNIQVLGASSKSGDGAGFSRVHSDRHSARFDAEHQLDNISHLYISSEYGTSLRNEIEQKIDKLLEPPPLKRTKPLPAPKEYAKQRRGGKRVKKMREQIAVTELRRLQNRVAFGVTEDETVFGDSVKGLGLASLGSMHGSSNVGSGHNLKVKADNRARDALKKKASESLANFSFTSGIVSSLSLTTSQGIQLQNPEKLDFKSGTASRYFSPSFAPKK